MESLIFIVIIFALAWVLFVLPSRRRAKAHQAMQDSVVLGDEVITAGGLHGIVREAGEDDLRLEIADGVVVTLDRRAVAAVARPVPGAEDDTETPEDGAGS